MDETSAKKGLGETRKGWCRPMKVVVVGGKLQGIEATYLAHHVGWEEILVARGWMVPAGGLCG